MVSRVKQALPQLDSDANTRNQESYQYGDENTSYLPHDSSFDRFCDFLRCLFDFRYGAFEKKRTSGTLRRFVSNFQGERSEIVYVYMLSFVIIAIFQTAIVVLAAIG